MFCKVLLKEWLLRKLWGVNYIVNGDMFVVKDDERDDIEDRFYKIKWSYKNKILRLWLFVNKKFFICFRVV